MFPEPLFRLLTHTQTDTLKTIPAFANAAGKHISSKTYICQPWPQLVSRIAPVTKA